MNTLKFDNKHISNILDRTKTATIRVDIKHYSIGEIIKLIGEDNQEIGYAVITINTRCYAKNSGQILKSFGLKYPTYNQFEIRDNLEKYYGNIKAFENIEIIGFKLLDEKSSAIIRMNGEKNNA